KETPHVELVDLASGKTKPLDGAGTYGAFSPDGTILAVLKHDGITRWDVAKRKQLEPLKVKDGTFHNSSAIAFSRDGKRLAAGSPHGSLVKVWDLATRAEPSTFHGPGSYVGFGADDRTVIAAGGNGQIMLYGPDGVRHEIRLPARIDNFALSS